MKLRPRARGRRHRRRLHDRPEDARGRPRGRARSPAEVGWDRRGCNSSAGPADRRPGERAQPRGDRRAGTRSVRAWRERDLRRRCLELTRRVSGLSPRASGYRRCAAVAWSARQSEAATLPARRTYCPVVIQSRMKKYLPRRCRRPPRRRGRWQSSPRQVPTLASPGPALFVRRRPIRRSSSSAAISRRGGHGHVPGWSVEDDPSGLEGLPHARFAAEFLARLLHAEERGQRHGRRADRGSGPRPSAR